MDLARLLYRIYGEGPPRSDLTPTDVDRILGDLGRQGRKALTPERAQRLALVLRRRYGLDGRPGESLAEIASRLHISRERVRQLEEKAINHLRTALQHDHR